MRICKDIPSGLANGLLMGTIVSANWTLNSTDTELLTGGSLKCLVAMITLTAIGGFVGFANCIRRDAREIEPDETDKTILAIYLYALAYLYATLPTLPTISDTLADLKERWNSIFKFQP